MKRSTTTSKTAKLLKKLLAAAIWLALWQALYMIVKQEILIVSPLRVVARLIELSQQNEFWLSAFNSLLGIIEGFLLAVVGGVLLAVLTSAVTFAYDLFKPAISVIKATPVASFIILALVWLPLASVPTFSAFLMVMPVVWANVTAGIKNTDAGLIEMTKVFGFSRYKRLKLLYAPSIMPNFIAACTTGMGMAWKAGIAAEVIGSAKLTVGGHLREAKVYLETADLFAWTVVVIVLSVLLELGFVHLMRTVNRRYIGMADERRLK